MRDSTSHHAAPGFFVFFAVAFPIQMVWRETELRFGSNQWFGVKPDPDFGQTNGLA